MFGPLLLGVMVLFFVMIFWGQAQRQKEEAAVAEQPREG